MKKVIASVGLLLVLPLGSADAMFRFCLEPTAPSLSFIRKPTKPFCASSGRCSEYEISSYKSDVEDYFRKLRRYAQEVETFYSEAGVYVKCMAELD